ncbi:MAG: tRNA (N6-isopentenyl adenosine(37)-C2)-methylthiotransferase MiaB [Clostridia bacterium]|nr:tRNA (N6-isopentenyl adenosine(37)-C2)-methylthiotransferase MiaB [Clostridia bacterium]
MREEIRRIPEEEIARQRDFMLRVRSHPDRPKTYFIVTYGCQMNAHDSEKLAGMLEEMGLSPAAEKTQADFVLHNTCCIRDNAERKALGNVIWLKEIKKERPDLLIGVCGCMVQQEGRMPKLLKQYPFIDLAFGTGEIHRLPEFLLEAIEGRSRVIRPEGEASTVAEGLPIRREGNIKAYLTIMYGCDNFCSYCVVPYVRGRERSRRADDIVREAEGLVQSGVKEIMLLGQNVNSYGRGEGVSFAQLLRRVAATGIGRIRFMTSHPKDLSDELIAAMADLPAVAPHLHLPVQSGSDRILHEMNRRYTRAHDLERVHALRGAMPDIGLTTDLIVAFPGETEAEFEETLSLVEEVRYDSAYTFIYSPRQGTRAAEMPGQIAPDVASARIERLIAAQERITAEIFESMKGQTAQVLVEGASRRRAAQLTGKSGRNINVNFDGSPDDVGKIIPVRITGAGSNTLRGEKEETHVSHDA